MEQKSAENDQLMEYFKQQMLLLKEKALLQASVREEKKLLVENAKLKKDIEDLKKVLVEKQKKRAAVLQAMPTTPPTSPPDAQQSKGLQKESQRGRRRSNRSDGKCQRNPVAGFLDEPPAADVSRLELRVGRILSSRRHPAAESLCVQEVDVGEAVPRVVVSGLMRHLTLEQMNERLAVLLCNLRPTKVRGVLSQAMLLCARNPERAELLEPPGGACPGDRVTVPRFSGEPDRELNPRQKVWEQVQSHLCTDSRGVATYQGSALEVRGKGFCRVNTLSGATIK